ncbi:hypothetical protein BESB_078210 [Besnoitia besnoiti]|uniref:Transmembrane protein n=1 Tax=Besnoitia besnoiti TaxID=94643 RepID=A0A2A9M6J3_BESBE|nr:hypothetical protein BESB_078210 [Besnoitia besnoiti]PFH33605.1 hypothetical protein BESB_078210 [Besnoitia besnoiti]
MKLFNFFLLFAVIAACVSSSNAEPNSRDLEHKAEDDNEKEPLMKEEPTGPESLRPKRKMGFRRWGYGGYGYGYPAYGGYGYGYPSYGGYYGGYGYPGYGYGYYW